MEQRFLSPFRFAIFLLFWFPRALPPGLLFLLAPSPLVPSFLNLQLHVHALTCSGFLHRKLC